MDYSTYNPNMENVFSIPSTEEKRTVLDGLGHQLDLVIVGGNLQVSDSNKRHPKIKLSKQEVEIFHAFLSVALRLPNVDREENLSEEKKLTLQTHDNPFIRLESWDGHIDIHPASWEPVLCEVALLLPRMRTYNV